MLHTTGKVSHKRVIIVGLLFGLLFLIGSFLPVPYKQLTIAVSIIGYVINIIFWPKEKPTINSPVLTVNRIAYLQLEKHMRNVFDCFERKNIGIEEQVRLIQYCAILVASYLSTVEVLQEHMCNYFGVQVSLKFFKSKGKFDGTIQIGKHDLVHAYIS